MQHTEQYDYGYESVFDHGTNEFILGAIYSKCRLNGGYFCINLAVDGKILYRV